MELTTQSSGILSRPDDSERPTDTDVSTLQERDPVRAAAGEGGVRGTHVAQLRGDDLLDAVLAPLDLREKEFFWRGRVSMSHLGFCAQSVVTFSASLRMLLIT